MSQKKKGQVSVEFMIFIGLAIIILAVFTVMGIMYINSINLDKEKLFANRLLDSLRNEVSVASRVDDGYIRMIDLPRSIGGWNYQLFFDKRYVFLRFEEEAEQGDIIFGIPAEIKNSNPPGGIISFEVVFDGPTKSIVVEKYNEEIYVCGLQEFIDNSNSCVE